MYIPLRKAVQELGLHPNTLRKYADKGTIPSIKNAAGQRLYDVQGYIRGAVPTSLVCYCRVSSAKQRDDLERHIACMRARYPTAELIRDVGSGLTVTRKGLRAVLLRLLAGEKLTLVVTETGFSDDPIIHAACTWFLSALGARFVNEQYRR